MLCFSYSSACPGATRASEWALPAEEEDWKDEKHCPYVWVFAAREADLLFWVVHLSALD